MKKLSFIILGILVFSLASCNVGSLGSTVVGSGHVVSETRNVSGFDFIELKGSGNVVISLGTTESVVVKADDNILPLIQTSVIGGNLIIDTKPLTSFTTNSEIQIQVTMKSFEGVTLSGSGNVTAENLTGKDIVVQLPGSGTISLSGEVNQVKISLPGSGNIFCDGLKAQSANVSLDGSGNVKVYASASLDANIRGSGNIQYFGNPAQVNTNVTGSGTITK